MRISLFAPKKKKEKVHLFDKSIGGELVGGQDLGSTCGGSQCGWYLESESERSPGTEWSNTDWLSLGSPVKCIL
jgi:hypothetical protein